MKVTTSQVSILIPSYKNTELTLKCLYSAIEQEPGEIIVSEDAGDPDLGKVISKINNKKVTFFYQNKNLGLWRNHFFLLKKAKLPWIKFMQMDDYMMPGALEHMCSHINSKSSIVSFLPVYLNIEYGQKYKFQHNNYEGQYSSTEFLNLLSIKGNILGRPSNNLYKRNYLLHDKKAWNNIISCDYLSNIIAGSKGNVSILSAWGVIIGQHSKQDGITQGYTKNLSRWVNMIDYIKKTNQKEVYTAIKPLLFVEFVSQHRSLISYLMRFKSPFQKGFLKAYVKLWKFNGIPFLFKYRVKVKKYYNWKFQKIHKVIMK